MITAPTQPDAADRTPKGGHTDAFERVFESLPVAVVVFDRSMQVIRSNSAARNLMPFDVDLASSLSRLTVEGRFEDWSSELRKVLDTRMPRRVDVALNQAESAVETYLNLLINPVLSPDNRIVTGGVLLAEDVTANISMERRLAVSERLAAVGKLAARVAHELNNPLDGLLRFTNLAIRRAGECGGDARLISYLENARTAIVRMSEITGDLLEFSRATPSTFEQATINRIVEDALRTMEGRAQKSAVTVVCNLHQNDMPVVRGSNLFQVFCNLIKNAVDAMPDGGTLTVTTKIEQPDVVVTVADTGIGLPPEMDRIFEPFFTTKSAGHGTGLGLAVSKDLIEKYGGRIEPTRNTPKGTVMTVHIPIANCSAVPIKSHPRILDGK